MTTDIKPQARSKEAPVGVYPRNTNWRVDNPVGFITIEQARVMRKSGLWFSINSGKDIAEACEAVRSVPDEKRHSGWKVVGQTAKNALRPGFPIWNLAN